MLQIDINLRCPAERNNLTRKPNPWIIAYRSAGMTAVGPKIFPFMRLTVLTRSPRKPIWPEVRISLRPNGLRPLSGS